MLFQRCALIIKRISPYSKFEQVQYRATKTVSGLRGGAENAGLENARLENDGLKSRAGKCRTGK